MDLFRCKYKEDDQEKQNKPYKISLLDTKSERLSYYNIRFVVKPEERSELIFVGIVHSSVVWLNPKRGYIPTPTTIPNPQCMRLMIFQNKWSWNEMKYLMWRYEDINHYVHANVNCKTIRKESCNWNEFISVVQCQMTPLKVWLHTALVFNHQIICLPQLQPWCAALVPKLSVCLFLHDLISIIGWETTS